MKQLFELLLVVVGLNVASVASAMPMAAPARMEVSQMPMAATSPIEPAKPKTAKKMPLRSSASPQRTQAWDWFSIFVPIHFFILFPLSLALIVLSISSIAWWWGLVAGALFFVGVWANVLGSLERGDDAHGLAASQGLVITVSLVMMVIVGAFALGVGMMYSLTSYLIMGGAVLGVFLLLLLLLGIFSMSL